MRTEIFIVKIKAVDEIKIGSKFVAFFGLLRNEFVSSFLTLDFIVVFGNLVTSGCTKFAEIDHDVATIGIDNPKFLGLVVSINEGLFHRNSFSGRLKLQIFKLGKITYIFILRGCKRFPPFCHCALFRWNLPFSAAQWLLAAFCRDYCNCERRYALQVVRFCQTGQSRP